ncbi:hypothetical protein [Pedobacter nanyangensis]|uniref:hypothetical protein n=1 Tax=Pedobacter nanyangensis TaxID=1562389 RepID=UPI000DE31A53|nr:hypothetical protein [Pedobacter nanyangensis]
MLVYKTESCEKEQVDLSSAAMRAVSTTSLDLLALEHCAKAPSLKKEQLLHTKPTFFYPKNGLYGLL